MARNGLQRHVTADKVKWTLTFIAFVLVGVMLAGILCGWFEKEEKPEEFGEVQTNVLVFDDIGAKRTAYGPDKQVWEENGITFTNLKGSGQDVGNYSAPIRLYAHSIVKVESAGMTKIVFYCNGSSYARELENSFEEGTDAAVSGSDVTVTFRRATDLFTIADLTAKVELDKIAVTTLVAEETAENMVISEEADENGVSLMSTEIPREEYDDYGIMPIAESAFVVTATVSGEGLNDDEKGVTWSEAEFKTSSGWGSDKDVSDYISTSPSGNQITVSCLAPFGEQIVITATSDFIQNAKASLTCDYKSKVGVDFTFWDPDKAGEGGSTSSPLYSVIVSNHSVRYLDSEFEWYRHYCFDIKPVVTDGTIDCGYIPDPLQDGAGASIVIASDIKSVLSSRYNYDTSDCGELFLSTKSSYQMDYPVNSFGDEALATVFGSQAIDYDHAPLLYVVGLQDFVRYGGVKFEISLHVRYGTFEDTFVIQGRVDISSLNRHTSYVD